MMVTKVVNQGLFGHQMIGFDTEKAAGLFNIPDDYQPISVIAIGYYGNAGQLPEDMFKAETEERNRRPLKELVFTGKFGEPSDWV